MESIDAGWLKRVSVMSRLMRGAGLVIIAGLTGLAGCGTTSAGSPGAAKPPASASSTPAPRTMAPGTTAPSPSSAGQAGGAPRACTQPGSYLTAVRTGEHSGYDRVAFQFSGGLPVTTVDRVPAVYADAKGTQITLAGQSYLHVVFHGASGICPQSAQRTWAGPSVLTPYHPQLLMVSAAGDFEGYLSFGVGLAARGSYHVATFTGPDRVVIDVSHVALGTFPGVWDITSWPQYWAMHYAWLSGHQPWRARPLMVVQAWASSRWHATPAIRQVNASTFKVTEPGGKTDTVTGARPVSIPGPWVITKITYGSS
jgi:hypothetical protein